MGSIKAEVARRRVKVLSRFLTLLLLIQTVTASTSKAQTWDEWFRQKKTQLDYLAKQIAELQAYGGFLKQGYAISQHGLGAVKNWASSEFALHSDYYHSLKEVGPALKNNPQAMDIAAYATAIRSSFGQLDTKGVSAEGLAYIKSVKGKVFEECGADLKELKLVMTSGQMQMKDSERIGRLDKIYADTKDLYGFARSFTNQVQTLLLQKSQEEQNIQTLKKYHGIN